MKEVRGGREKKKEEEERREKEEKRKKKEEEEDEDRNSQSTDIPLYDIMLLNKTLRWCLQKKNKKRYLHQDDRN